MAACRHSFDAAQEPAGSGTALPTPVVTGPSTLLIGADGTMVTTEGVALMDVSPVQSFEERDRFLARFLKKSLTRLATLGSSKEPIRQKTYTQFVQQATTLVAAFTQQLAHFEAVQRDFEDTLADMLLESQAILDDQQAFD